MIAALLVAVVASWYGAESGTTTASGQHYNPSGLSCAHRSLPFGTRVLVTKGGRSVVCTVNDRGPFVKGRSLDLSKGAADAIGLTAQGVGTVEVQVLGQGELPALSLLEQPLPKVQRSHQKAKKKSQKKRKSKQGTHSIEDLLRHQLG